MRVLVIGGAGYIGERLVNHLRGRGVDTVSTDVRPADGVDDLLDMRSASDVYRALVRHRPDVVAITAYILTRPAAANPVRAVETNVLGVANILQAAADLRLHRVVFTAAGAIYGNSSDHADQPVDENVWCKPRTFYGRMKQFNEWTAAHYNETTTTEMVSFRLSGPRGFYGPHGRSRNTGGASTGGEGPYDMILSSVGKEKVVTLPWAAEAHFRFIQVDDAAASYIPLLLEPQLQHRIYNSPGFTYSMAELATTAESNCNLRVGCAVPGKTIDVVSDIDSTRYENEFTYRPRPLAECLVDELRYISAASPTTRE